MRKVCNENKKIIREYLANPFSNMSYHDRLVQAGAVDLINNCTIEDLGNGYCKIHIIDENRKIK